MRLRRRHRNGNNQDGYVLLAILFALTLLVIAMAAAAPKAVTMGQRTKENELIRRGEQYALAIRRFYKKFGRYPSSMDQLENTNNIRFLRRKYLDPLTGKDDWTPIQFGQARPPLGFFGQKVVNAGGLSPSGPGLGPSTIGTGLGIGAGAGSSPTAGSGGTDTSSGAAAANNASGTSTSSPGGPGTGGPGTPSGPAGSASNPFSGDQLTGRTFGGGAIVGVSVPSQKESLKEFQQKNHYNEWQFVYDPTMDPTLRGGLGAGAATGVPGTIGAPGVPIQNPGGLNPTSPMTPQQNPTGPTGTTIPPSNPQ